MANLQVPVEGRDEQGRCDQGHVCCINEAPGHDDPHRLAPHQCGWCRSHENGTRRVTAP